MGQLTALTPCSSHPHHSAKVWVYFVVLHCMFAMCMSVPQLKSCPLLSALTTQS